MTLLCNGILTDDRLGQNRGLLYGDGIFRTMLVVDGDIVDADAHWRKLVDDCAALMLDAPSPDALAQEIARHARPKGHDAVRVTVCRRYEQRGYRPTTRAVDYWIAISELPPPGSKHLNGIEVTRSAVVLSAQPRLAGIKHLNRMEQVLASHDWPENVDESLMLDAAGDVICGTRSNLFCIKDGRLLTPSLSRCGVAGVTRAVVLAAAQTLGIAAEETELSWAEWLSADEAFVCNALIGIWPIRRCESIQWGVPGPVTRQLSLHLQHPRN